MTLNVIYKIDLAYIFGYGSRYQKRYFLVPLPQSDNDRQFLLLITMLYKTEW